MSLGDMLLGRFIGANDEAARRDMLEAAEAHTETARIRAETAAYEEETDAFERYNERLSKTIGERDSNEAAKISYKKQFELLADEFRKISADKAAASKVINDIDEQGARLCYKILADKGYKIEG